MSRTRTPGRTVLTLKLEPLLGSRFQPTGFPTWARRRSSVPDVMGGPTP